MKSLAILLLASLALVQTAQSQSPRVVYDGKTGLNQWYPCDKAKTSIFEKEGKVFAYINQSSFECFGIYFDPLNVSQMRHLEFQVGIENKYAEDSVLVYVSFIDAARKASDFRKLRVPVRKGPLKTVRLDLDDTIIKEIKVDFSRISSILFYVESKREGGFWGNVVLRKISLF